MILYSNEVYFLHSTKVLVSSSRFKYYSKERKYSGNDIYVLCFSFQFHSFIQTTKIVNLYSKHFFMYYVLRKYIANSYFKVKLGFNDPFQTRIYIFFIIVPWAFLQLIVVTGLISSKSYFVVIRQEYYISGKIRN